MKKKAKQWIASVRLLPSRESHSFIFPTRKQQLSFVRKARKLGAEVIHTV